MQLTSKEQKTAKVRIRKATGLKMKDINIDTITPHYIDFTFYATKHNRIINKRTRARLYTRKEAE